MDGGTEGGIVMKGCRGEVGQEGGLKRAVDRKGAELKDTEAVLCLSKDAEVNEGRKAGVRGS